MLISQRCVKIGKSTIENKIFQLIVFQKFLFQYVKNKIKMITKRDAID